MSDILIRDARILTMNAAGDVVDGDVHVAAGRIQAVGPGSPPVSMTPARVIDAGGCLLVPGFVQTHLHLCQTLFRGFAEDLPLLEWLRHCIWPLEAAHTSDTIRLSVLMAAGELLLSGTTSVLTMETTHHTDVVLETIDTTGLRATVGRCLMDQGDGVPARLLEPGRRGLDDAIRLDREWRLRSNGRVRIALAPRFVLSCSRRLLEDVAALSSQTGWLVHTHAAEQQAEIDIVERETGQRNIAYFASIGLATPRLCAAHCVWVDAAEQAVLAERAVKVLHCPSSNLKLGSGVAPVAELRARGVTVSLGTDGAACSNRLDMFDEMRLAATLQAMRHGPGALSARDVVWMATRGGAQTLGLDDEIGSIEVGKRADLVLVDTRRLHAAPALEPYSTLVYASRGSDVRLTMVDGRVLVDDGQLTTLDPVETATRAGLAARALARSAGLA